MSICFARFIEYFSNLNGQYLILLFLETDWTIKPVIISAPAYYKNLAHLSDAKFGAMFLDKLELYLASLLKMPMAFFNIAFSSSRS